MTEKEMTPDPFAKDHISTIYDHDQQSLTGFNRMATGETGVYC